MQIDLRLNEIDDCLYRLAVRAVIIEDHKLLVVREVDDPWWDLPGGGIDHHETIKQALERELEEELGLPNSKLIIDPTILFVTTGAVVSNIPRANLFYKVRVPADQITTTKDVEAIMWLAREELSQAELSPATLIILDRIKPMLA